VVGGDEVVTHIAIRRTGPDDVDSITAVHDAAVEGERGRDHYTDAQIDAWARLRSVAKLRAQIAERRFFIAESSRRPVGYAQLDVREAVLRSVYVRPECQRHGVGRLLAHTALREARDAGLQRLELDSSLNAVSFYEALGFVSLGCVDHELGNCVSMSCVRMARCLDGESGQP